MKNGGIPIPPYIAAVVGQDNYQDNTEEAKQKVADTFKPLLTSLAKKMERRL